MWLPFIALALPISLADLKTFTIPNLYLGILAALCAPHVLVNGVGQLSAIALVSFMLLILNLLGLGMGDVKLLMIILLTLNSDVQSDLTLLAVLIIISSAMYIMQKTLRDRRLPRRIPLAPSIFMGLALYLATQ
jgi:hypothetical protein